MKRIFTISFFLSTLAWGAVSHAQTLAITKGSGASMKVELGYGIVLNKESSLSREWYIVNDPRLPIQLESGSAAPKYVPDRSGGSYRYDASYTVAAGNQGVRAFEVRFLVLDVFGERQRLLSSSVVTDVPPEGKSTQNPQWNLFSESDASTAYYSIAYVASVRTESGQIFRANMTDVLREIQKISGQITASDIKPEKSQDKE
jgi:hypothetical protein